MSETAPPSTQPDPNILRRLRDICLTYPEAYEGNSFSHPCWRVRKKTFACYEPYGGEYVVNFKTDPMTQDRLVSEEPERFFVAPYTGRYGWVCMKHNDIDWARLRTMLAESYRLNAPKTLARQLPDDG